MSVVRALVYTEGELVKLALISPDDDRFELALSVESARNLAARLVVASDEIEAELEQWPEGLT